MVDRQRARVLLGSKLKFEAFYVVYTGLGGWGKSMGKSDDCVCVCMSGMVDGGGR